MNRGAVGPRRLAGFGDADGQRTPRNGGSHHGQALQATVVAHLTSVVPWNSLTKYLFQRRVRSHSVNQPTGVDLIPRAERFRRLRLTRRQPHMTGGQPRPSHGSRSVRHLRSGTPCARAVVARRQVRRRRGLLDEDSRSSSQTCMRLLSWSTLLGGSGPYLEDVGTRFAKAVVDERLTRSGR
jgi:hypothetical protein